MRTLNETELNAVAGGTFGLISGLLGHLHSRKSYDCSPKPAPKCQPVKCPPPKKGC